MPLATPQQYREMIDAARAGRFAYPAVNVSSSETLNAALRGFAEARSDGIVQITTSAAAYLSGPAKDMAAGAHAFAEFAHVLAARAPVLIALHTDHCVPEHVDGFLRPLLRESRRRRERGEQPLFNSHMFDGSQLPLNENLRISAELLRETNELDILLELEIGTVGGEEDGINNEQVARERLYTTRADALTVADTLGTGERGRYLLAATFGNVHGHYAPGNVELRPELLGELQAAIADRLGDGRGFDFVFHGGSGSSVEEIRAAVGNGVVKMNVDTDMQYAFTHAIESHLDRMLNPGGRDTGVDKRIYTRVLGVEGQSRRWLRAFVKRARRWAPRDRRLHATEDDQLAATREEARVIEPDASAWRRAVAIAVTGVAAIALLSVIVFQGGYFAVAALWIWLGLALLLAAAAARLGAATDRTRRSNRG